MLIGITGSFGSGKTTVARIFSAFGAEIIDADKIAHQVIGPRGRVYGKIIKNFGRGILGSSGAIDRSKLAKLVFDHPQRLKELNSMVHPETKRRINQQIKKAKSEIIILDAPLLIEAGFKAKVDKLIVVKSTRDKQIQRLLETGICTKSGIIKRINSQMALRKKLPLADFVIDNNGTMSNTIKQVRFIWSRLATAKDAKDK